ncbi:MAG: hypothetical protein JNM93_04460 [Bacteriovoracaceae bacterium]|nr:hypothetical protein [Bacteriovoracaceae bacterium]
MLSYKILDEITPYRFRSESELVKSIEELSQIFNFQREKIGEYLSDERLIGAYLYFYFATNVPKMKQCLELLPRTIFEELQTSQIIDFGCGPAPLFVALESFGIKSEKWGVELSSLMLEAAENICEKLGIEKTQFVQSVKSLPEMKKPFLVFTHSFNEISEIEAKRIIETLNPQNILFIEPGTKDVFKKLTPMREWLIATDYQVQYPCHTQHACPIQGEDDWCHQVLRVNQTIEVERLCQILKKDRRNLPVCLQWYSKTEAPKIKQATIFKNWNETKFSFEGWVCNEAGKIVFVQIMKKTLDKLQIKKMADYRAGHQIKYVIDKELDIDKLRVQYIDND